MQGLKLLENRGWEGQARINALGKELCGGQIGARKRLGCGRRSCSPDKNNESLSRGCGNDRKRSREAHTVTLGDGRVETRIKLNVERTEMPLTKRRNPKRQ